MGKCLGGEVSTQVLIHTIVEQGLIVLRERGGFYRSSVSDEARSVQEPCTKVLIQYILPRCEHLELVVCRDMVPLTHTSRRRAGMYVSNNQDPILYTRGVHGGAHEVYTRCT